MKIEYFYSACVKIITSDLTILCDPWFTEGVYDGSWYHFPKVENPIETIGDVDCIYISHIHPDHYDPQFLREYFVKYGKKKIIIADWNLNYLARALQRDGFEFEIILKDGGILIGETSLKIFPQEGKSKSDLDSILIVETGNQETYRCVVNANDTIFDEVTYAAIENITQKIDLLMLSYTGAGPFPQTFFELRDPQLPIQAKKKKKEFFDRYKSTVARLKPKFTLPFAGKYILGGALSPLNQYRGVSDPLEVTLFDDKALVPLDMGGCITTEGAIANQLRHDPYPDILCQQRLDEIKWEKFPYEMDISNSFAEKINFQKLLEIAYSKARAMSECDVDYYFCFVLKGKKLLVMNANAKAECGCKVVKLDEDLPEKYTLITVDLRYLLGLLLGVYHWDNARIGSHVNTRRIGTAYYRPAERFLNFLQL